MKKLSSHFLLVIVFQCLQVANGQNDTQCRQDLRSHMECMGRKHEENKITDDEVIQQTKDQIVQCFLK